MIKFHADDFGYSSKNIEATLQLIKTRKISSLSLLINYLSPKEAAKVFQNKPPVEVGLHINLVEGKPIANKSQVKTLVKNNGYFFPRILQILRILTKRASIEEVAREIESQIIQGRKNNLTISFLDSHQHLHAFSPVAEIFERLAKKHKIKEVRSFKSLKTFTFRAKIIKILIEVLARISHFIYFSSFAAPISWRDNSSSKMVLLTWESKNLVNIPINRKEEITIVIHPGLSYDKVDYKALKIV